MIYNSFSSTCRAFHFHETKVGYCEVSELNYIYLVTDLPLVEKYRGCLTEFNSTLTLGLPVTVYLKKESLEGPHI